MLRLDCPTCETAEPRVTLATRELMELRCISCGCMWKLRTSEIMSVTKAPRVEARKKWKFRRN